MTRVWHNAEDIQFDFMQTAVVSLGFNLMHLTSKGIH